MVAALKQERRWFHRDRRKRRSARRKLAGPRAPASLTKLEHAVKRTHTTYEKAETAQREAQRHEAPAAEAHDAAVNGEPDEALADAV